MTNGQVQVSSQLERDMLLVERILSAVEERYQRLVVYAVAKNGPLSPDGLAYTDEIAPYWRAYGQQQLLSALDRLTACGVLIEGDEGAYSLSEDWKEVADFLREDRYAEYEILGLREWLDSRNLVVSP